MRELYGKVLIVAAALAMSGCAAVVKVEPGEATIKEALTVTSSGNWNRFENASPRLSVASGANEIWTQEGLPLDVVAFFVGVSEGETLGAPLPGSDKALPPFRSRMLPHQIVELYEALTTQDGSSFKLMRLSPARFGGVRGFRFEHAITRKGDGLPLNGLAYCAVVDDRLYLLSYTAPKTYYYGRHLAEVEALAASARIASSP